MTTVRELAHMTMKSMGQENARKQRILARSPHLGYALDAGKYEGMSSQELAQRELSELGIKPDDRSVDEQLLDAHHAGRQWVRNGSVLGGFGGMKGDEASARRLIGGSAQDSAGDSAIERYIRGEA